MAASAEGESQREKLSLDDRLEPEFGGLFVDEGEGSVVLVGNNAVEDGVLDRFLEDADFTRRSEAVASHDLVAVDGRLEVADAVALLEVDELLTHELEIVEESLLALLVLRRDVSLAQEHQVVDVVAGLEEEASHGRIGNLFVGDGDGTHVQRDELLDVFHAIVQRQLQATENLRDHLRANGIVVVERPSLHRVEALRTRLADVV